TSGTGTFPGSCGGATASRCSPAPSAATSGPTGRTRRRAPSAAGRWSRIRTCSTPGSRRGSGRSRRSAGRRRRRTSRASTRATHWSPRRNFANKVWNIGRFILAQLPERVQSIDALDVPRLPLADRWILSRLQATIRETTASFEQFRLDEGAKRCFEFAWKELADWYVE